MVGGLDGSAAVDGRVGALSTPADATLFRALRALADVVLVGAETVRRERYGPVRLSDEARAARVAAGRAEVPRVAVVSRSLALDRSIPLFAEADPAAPPLVVTVAAAPAEARAAVADHAEVVVAGDDTVDLGRMLAELGARGLPVVWCEGGPHLLGELVAADLLDELCLTVAPLMGGDPLPVAVVPPGRAARRFELRHAGVEGDALFLRYEVAR
jgi:riboflavin biosynthesis pyrimidine reductase